MTLTDLANHICTQCGMTDTDDVAAAKMFLQRRLEMIWASALWRDSLLEATLTINPNDTTTLADSYWISERSVLLLPAAIEKVIAARINTNALEAASLESYYRTDTDWLNYQGSPFEFQVLKPAAMEWATEQSIFASDSNAADNSVSCNYSYSPDGVTITNGSGSATGQFGPALQLFSFSKPATQGDVVLSVAGPNLVPGGATYFGVPHGGYVYSVNVTAGATYAVTFGANDIGVFLSPPGTYIQSPGVGQTITVTGPSSGVLEFSSTTALPVTATVCLLTPAVTVQASCNNAPLHQRIRLTEAPQVSLNLRVLGKGKCPVLGPYDVCPITNVEPALMAFARGDLLLRQRQFGKATLAQQEGAALLKELVENEAFQQAGEFRIQPDAGFGSDNFWMQTVPDSYHPLG